MLNEFWVLHETRFAFSPQILFCAVFCDIFLGFLGFESKGFRSDVPNYRSKS